MMITKQLRMTMKAALKGLDQPMTKEIHQKLPHSRNRGAREYRSQRFWGRKTEISEVKFHALFISCKIGAFFILGLLKIVSKA